MFKHNAGAAAAKVESGPKEEVAKNNSVEAEKPILKNAPPPPLVAPKDDSPRALREMLEKNLKWSQIIYEQNRKINNKLIWAAVAGWLRLSLILVPLILAIIFLPSLLKSFMSNYGDLLGTGISGKSPSSSIERLLELLPVNSIERDQLKTILK